MIKEREYHQCLGVATKHEQCKLKTNSIHGYCHYHEYQQQKNTNRTTIHVSPNKSTTTSINKSTIPTKSGYIYVYTLTMFISKHKSWQFKVKNLPTTSNQDWKNFNAKDSPYVLIKIGMTTTTVEKRLNQWKSKCNHDISIIVPTITTPPPLQDTSSEARIGKVSLDRLSQSGSPLLRLFKKFHISNEPPQSSLSLHSFNKDGFYCKGNVRQVEKNIHDKLHKKYGRGNFYCPGCLDESKVSTKNKDSPFKSDYNVHIEWFLIPKSDLKSVFTLIDSICLQDRI
ncbi:hypothetical protein DFJ63DRAFT_333299 [Scheffersomyces coipomensis]|uniref:uncharacterized protein n=1 Tax=Scheffersomyces coipomensis TaxID=1788519 RepID=UPI00315D9DAF